MAGGYVGFQFNTDNEVQGHKMTFTFNPSSGGFVAKNLILGVTPLIKYREETVGTNGYKNWLSFGLGPMIRYYVPIGKEGKVYFFMHAAPVTVAAEWNRISRDQSQPYGKYATIDWNIGPGFSIMLAKGIAIEAAVYYIGEWHQFSLYTNGNLISEGKSYVDHGVTLNIGIHVYIPRRKVETTVIKS
jgi:hypothetical protein